MHRYHNGAATGDPVDALLYDNCERCEEHAENLFDLDRDHICKLWERMVMVETNPFGDERYRTINEAKACRKLYNFYLLVERFGTVDPHNLFEVLV